MAFIAKPKRNNLMLNAVSATGASDTMSFPLMDVTYRKVWQVITTGTATIQIRGSCDGTNWVVLTTVTATGATNEGWIDNEPWPFMDANVSAYTSGTVTVHLAVST